MWRWILTSSENLTYKYKQNCQDLSLGSLSWIVHWYADWKSHRKKDRQTELREIIENLLEIAISILNLVMDNGAMVQKLDNYNQLQ